MKKLCFFLLCIGMCVFSPAQSSYISFSLSDSTFIIGSVYVADIEITIDNREITERSKPKLDSIADFIKSHPELVLELGAHTDQRGSDSNNLVLSQNRAGFIRKYLVSKGVSPYAVAAVGYGETRPLVLQRAIDNAKGTQEQEELYQKNRRYEFKILNIYRNGIFSLTDPVFLPESTLRLDVLYDLGKPTLRPESYALIDSLARFLIAHPDLKAEIGNHTDARGSDAYNIKLTIARSQSVVDRLLMNGVPSTQILSIGYGESRPLVTEAYINALKSREGRENLHQLNRRTELKILSTGS